MIDFKKSKRFKFSVKSGLVGLFLLFFAASCFAVDESAAAQNDAEKNGKVTYQKEDNGIVAFFVDGQLFAQYRSDVDGTPIVWPICSADGTLMTRGYPMDQSDDSSLSQTDELKNIYRNSRLDSLTANKDHIHHRSLWFNHGNVNGFDFWGPDEGRIVERELLSLTGSDHSATIKTRNVWIPKGGTDPICEDIRTVTFAVDSAHPEYRFIDFDIELIALADSVVWSDTKEGSLGFRTPGSMDVEAAKRSDQWGGHILNNVGEKDEEAWGKRASWVDYFGPVPKRLTDAELAEFAETVDPSKLPLTEAGVVIMNHPTGFRYPSWYHVRTYGLFAVNPFGIRDFEPNARLDGSVTLTKGDKIVLCYRILIHDQKLSDQELDRLFDEYKAVKKGVD